MRGTQLEGGMVVRDLKVLVVNAFQSADIHNAHRDRKPILDISLFLISAIISLMSFLFFAVRGERKILRFCVTVNGCDNFPVIELHPLPAHPLWLC